MLRHLHRSLRAIHCLPASATGHAACNPVLLHRFWDSHKEHATRDFSTSKRVTRDPVYQQNELQPTTPLKDTDIIVDLIRKSTRKLEEGRVGKNLSSAEKRKFLVSTLLSLEDSREAVYGTLDAWVAFEQDFPLASLNQALSVLEKEEQWHRIVQVVKWMLSKGQGNTMRTYELLACALEKDNRAEEAHRIWEKKIGHDLHSTESVCASTWISSIIATVSESCFSSLNENVSSKLSVLRTVTEIVNEIFQDLDPI